MKRNALYPALLFALSVGAQAQEPLLPSDFFVQNLGKLEDTMELKPVADKFVGMRQHFGGKPFPTGSGQLLNFMSFCAASRLSTSRGFAGWSMTMKASDDQQPKERFITIAFLNSADDLKDLPKDDKWIDFVANRNFRKLCSQLVNEKYLWPDS